VVDNSRRQRVLLSQNQEGNKVLDLIRRNASSFIVKGILIIVIGAFVGTIGLIWGAGGFSGLTKENMALRVNKRVISLAAYNQALENKIRFYRNIYGERFSTRLMDSLRLREKTLKELIERELLLQKATALGFKVTDEEVRKRIFSYPMFQQDGIFNANLYRQLLRANRITPAEFEQQEREELLIGKLQNLIADRVKVTEGEIAREYRRQNEKISLQYLVFDPLAYEDLVVVEDDQLGSYFEKHKTEYRVAEQRRVEYLWVDVESLKDEISPGEEEVKDYYYEHEDEYIIPKQVQASHILIKVPAGAGPEAEEQARKKAEEIRRKLEAGEEFAKLAARFSDDEATAAQGGELGYFTRGKMVPAFERAAFSLGKGDLSQPVKTGYGYHIIKVTDIKPQQKKPLEEVRPQIEASLRQELAWERAEELADRLYAQVLADNDLQQAAQANSLEVKHTEFFTLAGEVAELGRVPQFTAAAFELNPKGISPPVKLAGGYALLRLLEVKPSYVPGLEEVKEQVRQALVQQQSRRLAKEKAEAAHKMLQSGSPLEEVANTYKLEVKDGGSISRQGSIKGIGPVRDWAAKLFPLQPGQVSPLLERENDNRYYLVVVKEVQPPDEDKFQQEKMEFALSLKRRKAGQMLDDWITGLTAEADIEVNDTLIR
jgi:peptidyl-prolyl cis-trans isomerase D